MHNDCTSLCRHSLSTCLLGSGIGGGEKIKGIFDHLLLPVNAEQRPSQVLQFLRATLPAITMGGYYRLVIAQKKWKKK